MIYEEDRGKSVQIEIEPALRGCSGWVVCGRSTTIGIPNGGYIGGQNAEFRAAVRARHRSGRNLDFYRALFFQKYIGVRFGETGAGCLSTSRTGRLSTC